MTGPGLQTVVVSKAHATRDRRHLDAQAIVLHPNRVWRDEPTPGNPISLCEADPVGCA